MSISHGLERIFPFLFSLSPGFEQILLAEDHSSLVSDLVIMTLPETRKLGQTILLALSWKARWVVTIFQALEY